MVSQEIVPDEGADGFDLYAEDGLYQASEPSRRELRRIERDRLRVRAALEQFALMVSDYYPTDGEQPRRAQRRPSERQLRKARLALERFAEHLQDQLTEQEPDRSAQQAGAGPSASDPGSPDQPAEPGQQDGTADVDLYAQKNKRVPDPPAMLVLIHWLRRNI